MINKKLKILIFIASSFLINFNFALASPEPISNMIIFGDSLSDIGNNSWIHSTGTPISNLDSKGHRHLWIHDVAQQFTKKEIYPSNKKNIDPIKENVSYAFASADSSNHYLAADWPQDMQIPAINEKCTAPGPLRQDKTFDILSTCVPGLQLQINQYSLDLKKQQSVPNPNSLFFIWSGANDILYAANHPDQLVASAQLAADNIKTAIKKLLSLGVSSTHIYVLDLPDLAKTPFAIKTYSDLQARMAMSKITTFFNTRLQTILTTTLDGQPSLLEPSHLISIHNLLDNVIANPTQYKLSNVTHACLDNHASPVCDGYLFFDLKHPTTQASAIIADYISHQLVTN